MTPAQLAASRPLPSAGRTTRLLWATVALLCGGVALASYRYLLALGAVPDVIAGNLLKHPWLAVHVAAAATALLVAPVQFLPALRARRPAIHRWIGRVYVAACLIGGAAGLALAFGASTGPVSTAGFGSLAVLWMVTTALAWRHAAGRRFALHRAWMIRSFALTFAAVTLRLYLAVLLLLPVSFDDGYRAISFLCWVPNLLAAELFLRRRGAR